MAFTGGELEYLATQRLGRLATARPDGTLQVSPVCFQYNPDTTTIDIVGYRMATSRKFRNVADNGRVAFVVDDIASVDPWRIRSLEIRGRAEAIDVAADSSTNLNGPIIRIHPTRIISLASTNLTKNPTCSPPTAATSQSPRHQVTDSPEGLAQD